MKSISCFLGLNVDSPWVYIRCTSVSKIGHGDARCVRWEIKLLKIAHVNHGTSSPFPSNFQRADAFFVHINLCERFYEEELGISSVRSGSL